jgi:hypothetical protein
MTFSLLPLNLLKYLLHGSGGTDIGASAAPDALFTGSVEGAGNLLAQPPIAEGEGLTGASSKAILMQFLPFVNRRCSSFAWLQPLTLVPEQVPGLPVAEVAVDLIIHLGYRGHGTAPQERTWRKEN